MSRRVGRDIGGQDDERNEEVDLEGELDEEETRLKRREERFKAQVEKIISSLKQREEKIEFPAERMAEIREWIHEKNPVLHAENYFAKQIKGMIIFKRLIALSTISTINPLNTLVIGDPSCLVADERVALADGRIMKIGKMGERHLQRIDYDLYLGKGLTMGRAVRFHKYENQPVIGIVTESGKSLKGTPNQPVLIEGKENDRPTYLWKRLDQLKVGDKVRGYDEDSLSHARVKGQLSERIVSIRNLERQTVYDIEAPPEHRFVANGIICHNTGKSEIGLAYQEVTPRTGYAWGSKLTQAGMTMCTLGRKISLGMLPRCHMGHVMIDEFNRIPPEDTGAVLACYTPDTHVLTPHGLRLIKELKVGDLVLSLNMRGFMEAKPVTKAFSYKYMGKLINFHSEKYSMRVTPNHRMLVRFADYLLFVRADWLASQDCERARIAITAKWEGVYKERINPTGFPKPLRTKDILEFAGWYITDGSLALRRGYPNTGWIRISEPIRGKYRHELVKLLDRLKWGYKEYDDYVYISCSRPLVELCKQMGVGCANKHIPEWMLQFSPKLLSYLYKGLMMGDGNGIPKSNMFGILYTSSKPLVEDSLELGLKMGASVSYTHRPFSEGMLMKEKRKIKAYLAPFYVNFTWKHNRGACDRRRNISQEKYKGKVVCVEVQDNHNLLVVHNGKVAFSGNSMQHGFFGVEKAWLKVERVPARAPITAMANPFPEYFKGVSVEQIRRQIPIQSGALLTRFHFILIILRPTVEEFEEITDHQIRAKRMGTPKCSFDDRERILWRDFVEYQRRRTIYAWAHPQKFQKMIKAFVSECYRQDFKLKRLAIPISPRMTEGMIATCENIAKAQMRTIVTNADVARSVKLLAYALEPSGLDVALAFKKVKDATGVDLS